MNETNIFMKSGDIISVFDPSILGQFRKMILRKSFTKSGIYLDIVGSPVVVTDRKGMIEMISLSVFLSENKYFVFNSYPEHSGIMRKIINSLGTKKKANHLIGELIGESSDLTPDQLYNILNETNTDKK